MSRGAIGVANMAWKTRLQTSPADDREGRLEGRGLHGAWRQAGPGRGTARYDTPPSDRVRSTRRHSRPDPMPIAARNRTGVRNELKMLGPERPPVEVQAVLEDTSDPRPDGPAPADRHQSISERPVSRRNTSSSDERRTRTVSGSQAARVGRCDGRLAVVGVQQDPVRQPLDPLARARRAARRASPGRRAAKRSSVTSRVEYCSMSDARRALGHDLAPCP